MFYFYGGLEPEKKSIYFSSNTLMSYIDLTTMGGSDKEGDETKIGTYCSGLKYAMALALRNGIEFTVKVFDSETFNEYDDRWRVTSYHLGTYQETCEQTGKDKELIQLSQQISKQSFFSVNCDDLDGGDFDPETIKTGFATKLGVDWQLWMLLREIYSNMIDEGGEYHEDVAPKIGYGTLIELKFDAGSEFHEIWDNRHLYINVDEPLFKISHDVDVLENQEGFLRIYKQNILVYSNKETPSKYAYNIKFGEIDEKRVLSNIWSVTQRIQSAVNDTNNEVFLRTIITPTTQFKEKEFLSGLSSYYRATTLVNTIATEIYEEHGEVFTYGWLLENIKKRPDCKLKGKIINTLQDSIYDFAKPIRIESCPVTISEPQSDPDIISEISEFQRRVNELYNFNVDVEVKVAELSNGNKVVADKHEKCIIIAEDFDMSKDFPTFVIHYIELTKTGNVVLNLGEYITELITK